MTHPTEPKLPESLEAIRAALDAGPTPGRWIAGNDEDSDFFLVGPEEYPGLVCRPVVKLHAERDAAFIAACNPEAITTLLDALKARDAEIERLRGDAERYRWLRDEAHPDRDDTGISVSEADFNDWGNRFTRYFSGAELDAAIDQARATGGEKTND